MTETSRCITGHYSSPGGNRGRRGRVTWPPSMCVTAEPVPPAVDAAESSKHGRRQRRDRIVRKAHLEGKSVKISHSCSVNWQDAATGTGEKWPLSRRLMPNTHRRHRRDSTRQLRHVGGVYWALACDKLAVKLSDSRHTVGRHNNKHHHHHRICIALFTITNGPGAPTKLVTILSSTQ